MRRSLLGLAALVSLPLAVGAFTPRPTLAANPAPKQAQSCSFTSVEGNPVYLDISTTNPQSARWNKDTGSDCSGYTVAISAGDGYAGLAGDCYTASIPAPNSSPNAFKVFGCIESGPWTVTLSTGGSVVQSWTVYVVNGL